MQADSIDLWQSSELTKGLFFAEADEGCGSSPDAGRVRSLFTSDDSDLAPSFSLGSSTSNREQNPSVPLPLPSFPFLASVPAPTVPKYGALGAALVGVEGCTWGSLGRCLSRVAKALAPGLKLVLVLSLGPAPVQGSAADSLLCVPLAWLVTNDSAGATSMAEYGKERGEEVA